MTTKDQFKKFFELEILIKNDLREAKQVKRKAEAKIALKEGPKFEVKNCCAETCAFMSMSGRTKTSCNHKKEVKQYKIKENIEKLKKKLKI